MINEALANIAEAIADKVIDTRTFRPRNEAEVILEDGHTEPILITIETYNEEGWVVVSTIDHEHSEAALIG